MRDNKKKIKNYNQYARMCISQLHGKKDRNEVRESELGGIGGNVRLFEVLQNQQRSYLAPKYEFQIEKVELKISTSAD